MKPFEIKIDNKVYEYIDSKVINNRNFVLYADDENLYISEYEVVDNSMTLKEVEEESLPILKEAFNIE